MTKSGCRILGFIAFAGIVFASLIGCLEGDVKLTLYPDGTGKSVEDMVLGEQMSKMFDNISEQVGQKPEEAILQGMKDNKFDFITDQKVEKKDNKYTTHRVGYFKDAKKAIEGMAIEKQQDGSMVITFKGKDNEKDKEKQLRQLKQQKAQLKDLKINLTLVCPGEITKADGFDSFSGREAKLSFDIEKVIKVTEQGKNWEAKIYCKAPSKEVETELAQFKDEYASAEQKAKAAKDAEQKGNNDFRSPQ